jgi:hypothetical protein
VFTVLERGHVVEGLKCALAVMYSLNCCINASSHTSNAHAVLMQMLMLHPDVYVIRTFTSDLFRFIEEKVR